MRAAFPCCTELLELSVCPLESQSVPRAQRFLRIDHTRVEMLEIMAARPSKAGASRTNMARRLLSRTC